MDKKINIIQFLPYFPPHKGGIETVWEEIGKYWIKKWFWTFINVISDFDQDIYLADDQYEEIFVNWEEIWYKKDWYEVLVVPSFELINNFPVYKIWSKKYKVIKMYLETKSLNLSSHDTNRNKELDNKKIWDDWRIVTHTRFFITSLIWWLFAKKIGVQWIHIEHWSGYVKLSSKIKSSFSKAYDKIIWKWIFKNADKVLAISKACKKFILDEFGERKVDVFYRGLDLSNIKINKKNDLKFVFVWRLVNLKWVSDLIDAYKNSWLKNELIIIWEWEEKEKLEKMSKWHHINFVWSKKRQKVIEFLSQNNCILINPSYQEWMPTTVIEWIACCCPVIASNVWGTREISNKNDLILFECWDVAGLEKKMIKWVKEYDAISWLSLDIIGSKFDWEGNVFNLYDLLK